MARKFLTSVDLNQNELQNARVQQLATAPSSPVEGQVYYNTTDHKAYIYNGTTWQALDESATASYGTPGNSAVGDSASSGSATTVARSDHVHGRESFGTSASTQAIGDSQAAGSASTPSRSDHKHAMPSFGSVTSETSFGGSSASGSATSIARSDHTHGNPLHDASAHSTIKLSDLAAPTSDVSLNSQKITNLSTPTSDNDAATKAYVDGVAAGLDVKQSVRVATTTNLNLSSPGSSIDGVTLSSGDRVLVKNQSTGSQNGIYVFNGASSTMTRATDADTSAEVTAGLFTFVEEGTSYADTGWVLSTNNPITLGTTSLEFTQFNASTSYTAGNGIDITGSTISAKLAASGGLAFSGSSLAVDTAVVARKYSVSIGNGSATSFTVAHGLGTADVIVQVYDNSTGVQIEADVTHSTSSPYSVTVAFTSAPSSNAYRVVVIG